MLKNLKNKKKKGFTLVELVVVIAIIAILAAVLVPQITGYIKESRKTAVIQEAREITTAVVSVETKTGNDIDGEKSMTDLQGMPGVTQFVDFSQIDFIPKNESIKLKDLENLLKEEYTFDLEGKILKAGSVVKAVSN